MREEWGKGSPATSARGSGDEMAFLDELSALLTSSTVAGSTMGWPVYLGHMPDSTAIGDKAVAVIDQTGLGYVPRVGLERPAFQVIVRGEPVNQTSTAYEDAQARAQVIAKALRDYSGQPSTSGARLAGVWNDSGPFFAGFDESLRPQFSANYRAQREST